MAIKPRRCKTCVYYEFLKDFVRNIPIPTALRASYIYQHYVMWCSDHGQTPVTLKQQGTTCLTIFERSKKAGGFYYAFEPDTIAVIEQNREVHMSEHPDLLPPFRKHEGFHLFKEFSKKRLEQEQNAARQGFSHAKSQAELQAMENQHRLLAEFVVLLT